MSLPMTLGVLNPLAVSYNSSSRKSNSSAALVQVAARLSNLHSDSQEVVLVLTRLEISGNSDSKKQL